MIMVGFENDYGKGEDKAKNFLFAVDLGAKNVAALLATPEPTTYATLGALLGGAVWLKRRQDRSKSSVNA